MHEYKDKVWQQYTNLPYPQRDPADEHKRLIRANISNLVMANHALWRGAKKFDEHFRVLDAGCGTGDSTIFLAEQLKHTKAQVVALDMSTQSLEIAMKRAAERKLTNIKFVEDSILNIEQLKLDKFDLVVSCGVLHHLENPEAGFKSLSNVLKPDGGMVVMLYAKYGRNGVYMMQELMRLINNDLEFDPLENTKTVLNNLRPTHWFSMVGKNDTEAGDAGIFDLLLHSRDRAYTVPDLYCLMENVELKLNQFLTPALYKPESYLDKVESKILLSQIKTKPEQEQQAISELLNSRMSKHSFYCSKQENFDIKNDDNFGELIPVFGYEHIVEMMQSFESEMNVQSAGWQIKLELNDASRGILRLIDGKKKTIEIIENVIENTGLSRQDVEQAWNEIYQTLRPADLIVLNHF